MRIKRIIFTVVSAFCFSALIAQETRTAAEADVESLRLYNEKKWVELLQYGKSTLALGIDFPYLRMRTGYAAFVLGKYSESLKQYEAVYKLDAENSTALYYSYLNNLYLNNTAGARYYGAKLPEETKTAEQLKATKISGLDLEFSSKMPDNTLRGNATYFKAGLNTELGYRLQWQNAFALYNQTISEPMLLAVNNNNNIKIAQKEYYTKLSFTATAHVQILGGFHYLYTPFNNFIYNNYIGLGGLKFTSPYVQVEGLFQAGRIRDSSYTQTDLVLTTYPMGNTKLYTISRAGVSTETAFTQIIGFRFLKKAWLEGLVTAGKYRKQVANDAIYVYDDIDTKKLRAGAGLYLLAGRNTRISLHYTFDQKEFFRRPGVNYNQHSITGGLQWTF